MTIDEAIFCMKSYLPDNELSCTRCKYYKTDTCQSRTAHKMAIEALENSKKMVAAEIVIDEVHRLIHQDSTGITTKPDRTKGHWIKCPELSDVYFDYYKCSECNRLIKVVRGDSLSRFPFCHCGADMKGE